MRAYLIKTGEPLVKGAAVSVKRYRPDNRGAMWGRAYFSHTLPNGDIVAALDPEGVWGPDMQRTGSLIFRAGDVFGVMVREG